MKKNILFVFAISIFIYSCDNDKNNNKIINKDSLQADYTSYIKITSPNNNDQYKTGDSVKINIVSTDSLKKIDSVRLVINNKTIATLTSKPYQFSWADKNQRVGIFQLKATAYYTDKTSESQQISLIFLSNITPVEYTYKVVKSYYHDPNAYTQGFVYEDGFIYEGTGQVGESTLSKYKLNSSELEKSYNLPNDVFGEGIVLFGNKIVQLTWQSHYGIIFDKKNFTQIGKFNYQTEGWGITNYENNLIMSDGSETLYVLDSENFSTIDQINVYDNKTAIRNLNELEYINGSIYANVYQTDNIIIIDPKTGKVTGNINLTNILNPADITQKIDVLNGIAYDAKSDRLFITGKWWPKIFEIKLIKN